MCYSNLSSVRPSYRHQLWPVVNLSAPRHLDHPAMSDLSILIIIYMMSICNCIKRYDQCQIHNEHEVEYHIRSIVSSRNKNKSWTTFSFVKIFFNHHLLIKISYSLLKDFTTTQFLFCLVSGFVELKCTAPVSLDFL